MTSLQQLEAQLRYAAGDGARRLAEEVLAEVHATAELGHRLRLPGPGLQQALGEARVDTEMDPGEVADIMAQELADGGVRLVTP